MIQNTDNKLKIITDKQSKNKPIKIINCYGGGKLNSFLTYKILNQIVFIECVTIIPYQTSSNYMLLISASKFTFTFSFYVSASSSWYLISSGITFLNFS